MNLTVNQPTNTNFKATIKSTKYFKDGVRTALRDVKLNPERAQNFYESVETILKSNQINNFAIAAKRGSVLKPGTARPYQIKLDGYKIEGSPVGGLIFDGEQCVNHVIDFAKKFLDKKPSKAVMSENELSYKMSALNTQVLSGNDLIHIKKLKRIIKDIKHLLKFSPEDAEFLNKELEKYNKMLKDVNSVKYLENIKS